MRREKLPPSIDELSGVTKAAILILSLETEAASTILKMLAPEILEDVTRELAGLGDVRKIGSGNIGTTRSGKYTDVPRMTASSSSGESGFT